MKLARSMPAFNPNLVTDEGNDYGWYEHDYQWSQGQLVILRKNDANGDQMQLNIWCTTGTIGSYLNHPRRGKTQLFRRAVHNVRDLRAILDNPRVHGQGGYYERDQQRTPPQAPQAKRARTRDIPCPACGKMYASMSATASHFESGSCPHCPGAEAAGRAAYAFARQREQQSGMRFTTGQQLLTFNGDGSQDFGYGYQHGAKNYACPSCGKGFAKMQGMLSHIEQRPQCQPADSQRALTFAY